MTVRSGVAVTKSAAFAVRLVVQRDENLPQYETQSVISGAKSPVSKTATAPARRSLARTDLRNQYYANHIWYQ